MNKPFFNTETGPEDVIELIYGKDSLLVSAQLVAELMKKLDELKTDEEKEDNG